MPRWGRRWTPSDVANHVKGSATRRARKRQTPAVFLRWIPPRVEGNTIILTYVGSLPRQNTQHPSYWARSNLKQAALSQFGFAPMPATQHATVLIRRVLGPREHSLDQDNMSYACKGLRDALPNRWTTTTGKPRGGGDWIVDDNRKWATFTYDEDVTRRVQGPMIEVEISYGSQSV